MNNFNLIIHRFKSVMPYIAVGMTVFSYCVAAWLTGALLSTLMSGVPAGVFLAYLIGVAVQLGAGTLVYFPVMDSDSPDFSRTGEVLAVLFGLGRIAEAYLLVQYGNFNTAIAGSVIALIAITTVLEVLLLARIKRTMAFDLARSGGLHAMKRNQQQLVKTQVELRQMEAWRNHQLADLETGNGRPRISGNSTARLEDLDRLELDLNGRSGN